MEIQIQTSTTTPRAGTLTAEVPEGLRQVLEMGVEIEQNVEAQYLRVGRSFTYGPIRRLFEEYAAEVRDHARILGRHLRDLDYNPTQAPKGGH